MAVVTVTERAAEQLRNILAGASPKEGQTLRLVPRPGGGFGLVIDQEREGDEVVKEDGEKILLMAPDMAEALDEATIDTEETEKGRTLVISR